MQISPLLEHFWRTGPGERWHKPREPRDQCCSVLPAQVPETTMPEKNRTQGDRARSTPPFFPFSSFLLISSCIWEEGNHKIFSPSSFLLKQVSRLSSYPKGLRIIVAFISAEGRWHLRWRAPDQPVSDKSHLFQRGKKLPTHEAAVFE